MLDFCLAAIGFGISGIDKWENFVSVCTGTMKCSIQPFNCRLKESDYSKTLACVQSIRRLFLKNLITESLKIEGKKVIKLLFVLKIRRPNYTLMKKVPGAYAKDYMVHQSFGVVSHRIAAGNFACEVFGANCMFIEHSKLP